MISCHSVLATECLLYYNECNEGADVVSAWADGAFVSVRICKRSNRLKRINGHELSSA